MQRLIRKTNFLPAESSRISEAERHTCSILTGIVTRDEHCMLCKYRRGNLTHPRVPGKTTQKR